MNISNETLEVLKNFSSINPNIVFEPGQKLKTISEAKNIMAIAETVEDFPEFGIYDLNEFLSVLNLIDNPSLAFDTNMVNIENATTGPGKTSVKYFFSDKEILTTPQKDITMPDAEFGIELTADKLSQIRKAAAVLGHSELAISGKDGIIKLSVLDTKDSSANVFDMDLDADNACKNEFNFIINIPNLKLLEGDYFVTISSKLISQWSNSNYPITYFIALEKSSDFRV